MIEHPLRLVITCILLARGASLATELRSIDAYVEAEMELNEIPGAAVAVWRDGDVVYAKGFGVRSAATGEPMTADTPVDLASVSKSLTAVAVERLKREGKLDLDSRVSKYLPELTGAFARIRLRELIRHTSGLTRLHDARLGCCGYGSHEGLDAAARRLSGTKLAGLRRGGFEYANSNYVLLAAVVQEVSGRSFPVFMRESVFRPLGMLRTTLDPTEARRWGLADPHKFGWREATAGPWLSLGWYGSSLVKSTARDMAGYLGWVLASVRRGWSEPYDGGWFVRRRPEWPGNPLVLEHGGNTWGGNTAAIVAPGWRMGAVVLLNCGVNRAAAMARGVLARYAGLAAPRPQKAVAGRNGQKFIENRYLGLLRPDRGFAAGH